MNLREPLMMLASLMLGMGCIHLIGRLDRYEREPMGKMALATLVGGGWSVIAALLLFDIIARLGFDDFESAVGAMAFIGPVEELAKLSGLLIVIPGIRRELNEPADGIIYMACVAMGFSLVENYLYAVQPHQTHLLLIRLLVATPMHIGFSALMGISFYLWYRNRRLPHLVLIAYLLASLSHGLWDLIIFNGYSIFILGGVFILIYAYTRNLFFYAMSVSPHRIGLAQTVNAAGVSGSVDDTACPHCGDTGPKPTQRLCGSDLSHCDTCGHYLLSSDGLYRLFFHFAGVHKRAARKHLLPSSRGGDWLTLFSGNHLNPGQHQAIFRLPELDAALERCNHATKRRMRTKWYLPHNLERLAQPGGRLQYGKMIRDAGAALERWLAAPLTANAKGGHRPPERMAPWNWGAFLLPEWWYGVHGLWRAVACVAGSYLLAGGAAALFGGSMPLTLGAVAVVWRWVSGRWGARIHYRQYGRWPS